MGCTFRLFRCPFVYVHFVVVTATNEATNEPATLGSLFCYWPGRVLCGTPTSLFLFRKETASKPLVLAGGRTPKRSSP